MAEEEVGFRLALKNRREVERGVHSVGDEFDRVGDEASRAGRKARTIGASGMVAFGKSGRLAGRAVVTGFGAAAAAVVGTGIVLTKLSKDSIAEAREAQKVGAITRAQIKATGQAANISAKGISNLSGRISAKVGIDDEEIQSGANKILMYKNVRNEMGKGNKIFDRATLGAVNLSAVTGTLTTNSKLLGKVLNDPTKAITGLTKAGVKFTDQQVKQIEAFDKQGNRLAAQKIILKQVEDRVGGVAAKQATWGEKASVSIGNIKESIGLALLPELDKVEKWFVQKGAPVLENYVGIFEKRGIPKIKEYAGIFVDRGIPAMRDFADEAKPVAESILPAIGTGFSTIADAVKVIAPRMKSIFDGFNDLPDWAQKSIMIGAGGTVVAKKLGVGSLLGKSVLGSVASMAKPLPVLVTNPGFSRGLPNKPGLPTADDRRTPTTTKALTIGATATTAVAASAAAAAGIMAIFNKWAPDSDIKGSPQSSLAATGGSGLTTNSGWRTSDFKDPLGIRKFFGLDKSVDQWVGRQQPKIDHFTRDLMTGAGQATRSIDKAKTSTDQLVNVLRGADKNWRPAITVDGLDSSLAKANALSATLFGLPGRGTYGNGLGVVLPGGPPKPKKRGKGGGRVAPRAAFPNVDPSRAFDDDFFGAAGGAVDERPVQLVLRDGRVIAELVRDGLEELTIR